MKEVWEENRIYYTPFGKETIEIDLTKLTDDFSNHGGGDVRMIRQFADYVMTGKKTDSITDLSVSLESHYIALELIRIQKNERKSNDPSLIYDIFLAEPKNKTT